MPRFAELRRRGGLVGSLLGLMICGCYTGVSPQGADAGTSRPSTAGDSAAESTNGGPGSGGGDESAGDEGPGEPLCETLKPGPAPVRRLTRTEYNRTLADLLGDDSAPADGFIGEDVVHGFDNAAIGANISRLLTEQFETAAKGAAQRATSDLTALLDCDPAVNEDGCIDAFIADFGLQTYRRPLADEERTTLRSFYDDRRADNDPAGAVALMMAAMLQSPHFLYRVEVGRPELAVDGAVPLTDYEVASRLSYLLWNSMPDAVLFDAAAAGELSTGAEVAAQTERMLEDERAESVLTDFHEQWLALRGNVPTGISDQAPLLRKEVRTFIISVLRDGDGKLDTLLRANYSFMNRELAEYYGVNTDGLGAEFERVELDPTRRAGLLTSGLLLALQAEEHESAPIKRGHLVRERVLCQPPPPVPPGLMVELPDPDPNQTTRERYAQHREDPACAGCHVFLDPIGFGFEHYDQFGLWRDFEYEFAIDASGELSGVTPDELNGPFYGAVELAERLAASETFQECATDNWFRYAYGREATDDDECTVDFLNGVFADSGGSVAELLRALTQSDAFRFRPVAGGE